MTQFIYGKAIIFTSTCFKTVTCLFLQEFGYSIFFSLFSLASFPKALIYTHDNLNLVFFPQQILNMKR